jgi:uncharacterized protein
MNSSPQADSAPRGVVVIGASRSREKFGNKAVRAYLDRGESVYPVNPAGGEIAGCPVFRSLDELPVESVDLVSLYVHPDVGIELLDAIAKLRPREVWLNPGSESNELIARAQELNLPIIQACSILSLGKSPADY